MEIFKKSLNILSRNRLYLLLILFIVCMNLAFSAAGKRYSAENSPATSVSAETSEDMSGSSEGKKERRFYVEEEMRERQERLKRMVLDDPLLYIFIAALNLSIYLIVTIGILLDIYILIRCLKKDIPSPGAVRKEPPRWSVGDVLRVVIIFVSCSYLFAFIQGAGSGTFPILRNNNFRLIFNTAVMNIVGITVIFHFVVKKHGQSISAIGMTMKKAASNVFYSISGYVALVPILLLVMVITFFVSRFLHYKPPIQPIVKVFIEEETSSVLWLSIVFAAVFGPIAEEIFFRGFMYTAVRKKFGMFWGIMSTSAIFSILHTHPVGFVPIMLLGMLLAYVYEKTGSILSSISVHVVHNVGMLALVYIMRQVR